MVYSLGLRTVYVQVMATFTGVELDSSSCVLVKGI
jgi:hypothetical protein